VPLVRSPGVPLVSSRWSATDGSVRCLWPCHPGCSVLPRGPSRVRMLLRAPATGAPGGGDAWPTGDAEARDTRGRRRRKKTAPFRQRCLGAGYPGPDVARPTEGGVKSISPWRQRHPGAGPAPWAALGGLQDPAPPGSHLWGSHSGHCPGNVQGAGASQDPAD